MPGRFAEWRTNLQSDFGASVVVFLVALPLSMGVALASGMPVAAGLVAAVVGGIVVGAFAGSPLQVSGPAAGLTVLVYQLVQQHGIERLGVIVLMAGLLQIAFGVMRLGLWFRAVSPAVVLGMLAGIGILIFAGQFHVMVDDLPKSSGLANLLSIPEAVGKGFPLPALETSEQRVVVRRRMQQLSGLHQRQYELQENVRHVLSAEYPQPPIDDVEPSEATNNADYVEAERDALRELVSQQQSVLDELVKLDTADAPQQWRAAVNDVMRALDDLREGDVADARTSQAAAERSLSIARDTTKHHGWAATIGMLTILVLIAWESFMRRKVPFIPAAAVAVSVAAVAANFWQLPVLFVELPTSLGNEIFIPNLGELAGLVDVRLIMAAIEVAIIAAAETLLCATAIDRLHSGPRTNYDRELIAQGIGNTVCGFLRALPISGVIVRSSANIAAGAKSRGSTIMHGVWILIAVTGFTGVLQLVPTSALAALLVYTGYKLADYRTFLRLWRQNRFEGVVFLGTALAIVATNLLTGVLIGVALSVVKLLYEFSRLEIHVVDGPTANSKVLHLRGNAVFLRLPYLAAALDDIPRDSELHLNLQEADYIDYACTDLLNNWQREAEPFGGRLVLDRDSLADRFWRRTKAATARIGHGDSRLRRDRQVPI